MKKAPLLVLLALGVSCQAAGLAPRFSWTFAANRGSALQADLHLVGADGKSAPLFSRSGQGVSGKAGDHAFDLESANGTGATTLAASLRTPAP